MSKVVFNRAIDMANLPVSHFTDGSVDSVGNTQIHITSGAYSALVVGQNFISNGPVNELHGFKNGVELIAVTGLNIPILTLQSHLSNGVQLANDLFGGADTFKGSKFNDGIVSIGGDDKLNGAKGMDTLNGGAGADKLMGGADADTFLYSAVSDSTKKVADLILDLDAQDFIDLEALGVQGDITSAYNATKDITYFSIDVDGDNRAEMVITAAGDHAGYDLSHFLT